MLVKSLDKLLNTFALGLVVKISGEKWATVIQFYSQFHKLRDLMIKVNSFDD